MKFLVDAQLPPILAEWLRKAGHEARHVDEVDLRSADDATIRTYANQNAMVVITKDRDFIPAGERGPDVIWIRTGNIATRTLIDRIEVALPQLLAHLAEGARLVELR